MNKTLSEQATFKSDHTALCVNILDHMNTVACKTAAVGVEEIYSNSIHLHTLFSKSEHCNTLGLHHGHACTILDLTKVAKSFSKLLMVLKN